MQQNKQKLENIPPVYWQFVPVQGSAIVSILQVPKNPNEDRYTAVSSRQVW